MTRRLAITILLTVWTAIVFAGLTGWWTARAIMLADLDASIVNRAAGLAAVSTSDRFVVKGPVDRTLQRQSGSTTPAALPQVLDAAFVRLPEGRFRNLTLRIDPGSNQPAATVVYSGSAAEFDRVLSRLAVALILCGTVAGFVAALAAVHIARMALRPLDRAVGQIASVGENSLDRRIDAQVMPAEFRPLVRQLNQLLSRLELAFDQRRRFLADASHELRTPVAAMVTTMEVTLRRPRAAHELEQTLGVCLSEARHMRKLVTALMSQVRSERPLDPNQVEDFDAAKMVEECAQLAGSLADERRIRLVGHHEQAVPLRSEAARLRSVIMNLVSNAIEYSHPGGKVEVSACRGERAAEIVVKDDGPGIASEHLKHIFQPFFRIEHKRGATSHLGLGLFLVDSHVRALGGECHVESEVGKGTTFRVRVPISEAVAAAQGVA